MKFIEEYKDGIEDKEIIDDNAINKLVKMKDESSFDNIVLSKLFIVCFDYLDNNKTCLEDKDIKKYFDEFINKFIFVEELRQLIESYGNGFEIGSQYDLNNIGKMINENRGNVNNLINVFFQIFREEA